jgi:nicotinate-nucleotide adenylyltransferase
VGGVWRWANPDLTRRQLPVETNALKPNLPIVFFGGTFDPVHLGHVAMARAALAELNVERLIVLPVGNPYQRGRTPFASPEHRVEMLRLAFESDANISIDERELRREGPTYTFDTLTDMRHLHGPDVPFIWLIGSDAFAKLDTWHQWRGLLSLTNFAVIMRDGAESGVGMSAEFAAEIAPRKLNPGSSLPSSGAWIPLKSAPPPISSTAVRAAIANHESIRAMVPAFVCDYIEKHKLY